MKRLFVVPAVVLLALPLSVAAFAQDATQTQTSPPMAHDSMGHSTAMSHGGAMAHDSMGHAMSHDTMGHGAMGHSAMSHATPDKMSAPEQPK